MQGQGVNSILHASPGTLLFPNQLSLWLEGYGLTGTIDVVLEGSPYPQAAWPTERSIVRERLTLTREGLTITRNAWSSLSNVTVRGLPTGARLRIWMLPVSLPMLYDGLRPYADAGFRDKLFDRYWSIENDDRLLVERYWASSYGGFEYVNSYKLNQDLTGLAIEPLTWGMWAAAGSQLFYSDRRELMPDLSDTGLTSEPLWGMKLEYADDRHGAVRSLRITPIQYPSAGAMTMHRYVVRDPEGSDFVLSATGALQDYTGSGGWDTSWPKPKVMPMSKTGTYQITLECRDGAGNLRVDTQPYRNAELLSLASFDLGSQLASIDGLAFDYLGQLWAWTGSMAVPLSVSYDAYVLDRDINSIFTTDQFDELRIS
jgi:hypothetical protein